MATIELGSNAYADPALAVQNISRRPLFPAIRWGAIFAGVAVGLSVQLILALLGVATGLASVDVTQGNRVSGTGPLIWAAVSMLISAFIGGYVAARMSNLKRKVDGLLHGAVSWAVTTLLFVSLATSVGGSLLSGVFTNVVPNVAQAATSSGGVASMLKNRLGVNADPSTLRRLQNDIQAGRRDDAVELMVGSMNMDRSRAETVVDQALIVSGSPQEASPQGRETANSALRKASAAAWGVFFAVLLSLVLGVIGGLLGAMGARRTAWTRTETETAP
jgi:hypothetical protein